MDLERRALGKRMNKETMKKYYYFIMELNFLLHVNRHTTIRLGKACVPMGNY